VRDRRSAVTAISTKLRAGTGHSGANFFASRCDKGSHFETTPPFGFALSPFFDGWGASIALSGNIPTVEFGGVGGLIFDGAGGNGCVPLHEPVVSSQQLNLPASQ
jgi:hypothetical protein